MKIPCMGEQCDVLIIGSGFAALMAALEAKKWVEDVIIVSKGKIGRSGNTVVSRCRFGAHIPHQCSSDSVQHHFQDTLIGGKFINDESLVATLASQAGQRVLDLEGYGVRFCKVKGDFARQIAPGHSYPRSISTFHEDRPYAIAGLSITLPLLRAVKSSGVRLIEDISIAKIAVSEGMVCGAIGLDVKGEGALFLRAKAVILAAGGGGRIFARTDNTRPVTGDSYALALEARAVVRDMEFVQFYPLMMTSPVRALISTLVFGDGAVLRNEAGERFMFQYDENGEMVTRDLMSRAIFCEMRRSKRKGIYLDCSAIPLPIMKQRYSTLHRLLESRNIDMQKVSLLVSPTTHFFMGGVEIDESCQSSLPGLYATGEAVGGVHGANRLSGNALSEAVVFGAIAGEHAANHARRSAAVPRVRPSLDFISSYPKSGDITLREIRHALRRSMWEDASIIRSEDSLRRARSKVEQCRRSLKNCSVHSFAQAVEREEIRRMCIVAEAIVASALHRKESRGAHYREDFPSSDEDWLGRIEVMKVADQLRLSFVPKGVRSLIMEDPQ